MTRYQDEDERDKISWREIDRRRARSPYAPKEAPEHREKPSRRSEWIKKQYRKEADKLFLGKKGTKKHQKALDEIERTYGTDQFNSTVRSYLEEYGLPGDWSTLSLLLDYSDAERVPEVMRAMKNLHDSRTALEKQGFKAKLEILAMTSSNGDLRELAEEILKTL